MTTQIAHNPFVSLYNIKKHSTEIIAFLEGKKIQVKAPFSKEWKICEKPSFLAHCKYRISPEILFKNDAGEEFTEKDINSNLFIYYYSFGIDKIVHIPFRDILKPLYKKNDIDTAIYKTKIGALLAAAEHYSKLNNKSLNK